MDKFVTRITNLIEVKKIIALMVVIVFCVLATAGRIEETIFTNVVTLIVGYYFGQSSVKQIIHEQNPNNNI